MAPIITTSKRVGITDTDLKISCVVFSMSLTDVLNAVIHCSVRCDAVRGIFRSGSSVLAVSNPDLGIGCRNLKRRRRRRRRSGDSEPCMRELYRVFLCGVFFAAYITVSEQILDEKEVRRSTALPRMSTHYIACDQ